MVTGAFGEEPALDFPSTPPSNGPQAAVISAGDGGTVEAGDILVADVVTQVWAGDRLDRSHGR